MNTEQEIITLLEELLRLTKRQASLIEATELEGMDENLQARQECLQKLNQSPLPRYQDSSPQVAALVADIQAREHRNVEQMHRRMTHLKTQMQRTNHGKTTLRHYESQMGQAYSTFDRRK